MDACDVRTQTPRESWSSLLAHAVPCEISGKKNMQQQEQVLSSVEQALLSLTAPNTNVVRQGEIFLKQYMKSVIEDHLQEEEASGYLEDQIRQHQMKVQNFFHRVQAAQSMLDRSSKASMAVHVNAVVKEGILPNFNFNFGNFNY